MAKELWRLRISKEQESSEKPMENDQTEAEIDETIEERISNTSQHSDENGEFSYFGTAPTYDLRTNYSRILSQNFDNLLC